VLPANMKAACVHIPDPNATEECKAQKAAIASNECRLLVPR
jgi:hypothetical protein